MKRIAVYLSEAEYREIKKKAGLVPLSRWVKELALSADEVVVEGERGRRVEKDSAGF